MFGNITPMMTVRVPYLLAGLFFSASANWIWGPGARIASAPFVWVNFALCFLLGVFALWFAESNLKKNFTPR